MTDENHKSGMTIVTVCGRCHSALSCTVYPDTLQVRFEIDPCSNCEGTMKKLVEKGISQLHGFEECEAVWLQEDLDAVLTKQNLSEEK